MKSLPFFVEFNANFLINNFIIKFLLLSIGDFQFSIIILPHFQFLNLVVKNRLLLVYNWL